MIQRVRQTEPVNDTDRDRGGDLSGQGESPQIVLPTPRQDVPVPSAAAQLLSWADQHRTWLMAAMVVVYVIGFTNQWRAVDDSATHMAIARAIVDGVGYEHPNNHLVDVSPGLPYTLAAMMEIFGKDVLWPAHLMSLLMAFACLWITYTLIKLHGGRPTAVLVTFLLGFTERFYQYAFSILTDLPFLTGVMMFLLGYEWTAARTAERLRYSRAGQDPPALRGKIVRAVALMAVGTLLMGTYRDSAAITFMAAVIVTVTMAFVRHTTMPRWHQAALAALVVAAVIVVRWLDPRSEGVLILTHDEQVLARHLTNFGESLTRMFTKHIPELLMEETTEAVFAIDWGALISVPLSLVVLVCGIALLRERRLWGVLVLVYLAQWILIGPVARYYLVLMPLLVFAWWRGTIWLAGRCKGEWPARVVAIALLLWFIPNVIRIGDFIIMQHRQPFLMHFKGGMYQPYYELGQVMREQLPMDALVIANRGHAARLSCFSDRHVRSFKKAPEAFKAGRPVFVVEPMGDILSERVVKWNWQLGDPVLEYTASNGKTFQIRPMFQNATPSVANPEQ